MQVDAWVVRTPGEPMVLESRDEAAGEGEVVIAVEGCGVCHTDLGYYYDGVPTRHGFPLALGHEIAGRVVECGPGAEGWQGKAVIVPAVIPCGSCAACEAGRGQVCPTQIFPGNDVHGGFATHVRVPARGLCEVGDLSDPAQNPAGLELCDLAVIADAVSTPYQAIVQSGLGEGDLAVFVGIGGVGGFGVQIAATLGAHVIAIDPSADRRALLSDHGAALALDPVALGFKPLKKKVRGFAKERGVPSWRHYIFETSGTPAGQTTAFGLVGHGAYLSVIGFTRKKIEIRLSNLMAFDATARGSWGCLPEHYPAVARLALEGKVALAPFIERRPLSAINETFADLHAHRVSRRVVFIPDAPR